MTKIKCLILDVDGVLTDGRLCFTPSGDVMSFFHVRDGYGLKQLMAAGIHIAIISGRDSPGLRHRLNELGIDRFFLGVPDKTIPFNTLKEELNIDNSQIAYIGDDTPDLCVMTQVALPIAVFDAHPSIQAIAKWQTQKPGGQGAVREACDFLLSELAGHTE